MQKKQEIKQRKISLAAEIVFFSVFFFFSSKRINDFQTCKLNFRVKQHSMKTDEPSNSRIVGQWDSWRAGAIIKDKQIVPVRYRMRKLDLQHFLSAPPPDLTRKIIEKSRKNVSRFNFFFVVASENVLRGALTS